MCFASFRPNLNIHSKQLSWFLKKMLIYSIKISESFHLNYENNYHNFAQQWSRCDLSCHLAYSTKTTTNQRSKTSLTVTFILLCRKLRIGSLQSTFSGTLAQFVPGEVSRKCWCMRACQSFSAKFHTCIFHIVWWHDFKERKEVILPTACWKRLVVWQLSSSE